MMRYGLIPLTMLAAAPLAGQSVASLAGVYDGGQIEIAAGLELRGDGRFRYGLSYGALDEQAEGSWRVADGQVLLTSDPVKAPQFMLLGQRALPTGQYRVVLDLPKGVSPQYFDAVFRFANGEFVTHQLSEDQAAFRLGGSAAPVAMWVSLGMFDVSSAEVPMQGAGGYDLQLRFAPNDLGKVAFSATPLRIEGGALVLERHGRTLRFRRDRE